MANLRPLETTVAALSVIGGSAVVHSVIAHRDLRRSANYAIAAMACNSVAFSSIVFVFQVRPAPGWPCSCVHDRAGQRRYPR
jgi:hypothetical protein